MPRLVFDDEVRPQPRCPRCGGKFSQASLRIFDNTANCESCHQSCDLSSLASDLENAPLTAKPPKGVSVSQSASGWRVRARSVSRFSIVANCIGIVLSAVFVKQYLGAWDPIPIAIVASMPASIAALYIWGKCEIRVKWPRGTVFTGVGRLGTTHRFNAAGLQTVTLRQDRGNEDRAAAKFIELQGQERVVFGQHLDDSQRLYIASLLVEKLNAMEATHRASSPAVQAL